MQDPFAKGRLLARRVVQAQVLAGLVIAVPALVFTQSPMMAVAVFWGAVSVALAQIVFARRQLQEVAAVQTLLRRFYGAAAWKWGTPDYLQRCMPNGAVNGLPMNFFTYQEPFEGASCAGMVTYCQNGPIQYRDWVMAPLLEPLVIGETYYCSFRANAGFGGNHTYPQFWLANNKVGMLFTMQPSIWTGCGPLFGLRNYAHLHSTVIISDTANWTLVSGSFVADSAYQYLVIGNFFSNALTDTMDLASDTYVPAYYFVDGVCVRPSGQPCEFMTGIAEPSPQGPSVWPNPAEDHVQVRVGSEVDNVSFSSAAFIRVKGAGG